MNQYIKLLVIPIISATSKTKEVIAIVKGIMGTKARSYQKGKFVLY